MHHAATILTSAIAAGLLILLLFEVTFNPYLCMPGQQQLPEPEQELAYTACVDDIRRSALAKAYAETDNPEVHSTMVRIAESDAQVECRHRFPQQLVSIESRFDFNIVDLRFRY